MKSIVLTTHTNDWRFIRRTGAKKRMIMKRIYLLEVFFSFDGVEYTYKFSRVYSSAKEMRENIEYWEKTYKYSISLEKDGEITYITEIGSFYKLRISHPIVNNDIF